MEKEPMMLMFGICLLDELVNAKEKYKNLSDELENTLTDISGM